jgi:hypothetical protein
LPHRCRPAGRRGGRARRRVAFAYTFGLALQQKANLATVGAGSRRSTVWRVVSSRWWVLGFVLGVAGFLLHGVALAVGS